MSFTGRYIIDRIKRSVGKYLKMPVPPYENPNYWEGVYSKLGANDVFEWADLSCEEIRKYSYKPINCEPAMSLQPKLAVSERQPHHADTTKKNKEEDPSADDRIETTLEETLAVTPGSDEDQPILILGCGNSRFGEDLLEIGLATPIVQIDVSQRVVETLSIRCRDALQTGDMLILQDDATVLSAIPDASCQAVVDKGMVDAIFCADAYRQCWEILYAVHRVLRDDGVFVVFSYSNPEFILQKLMIPDPHNLRHAQQWQRMWSRVECRQSDYTYLYRFSKAGSRRLQNVQKPQTQQTPRKSQQSSSSSRR